MGYACMQHSTLFVSCLSAWDKSQKMTCIRKGLSGRSCGKTAASEIAPCLLVYWGVAVLLPQDIASCMMIRHVLAHTVLLCSQHVHHVQWRQARHALLQQAGAFQLMTLFPSESSTLVLA